MDKADKFSTEVKMLRSENALLQDELRRAKVTSIHYVSTYKRGDGAWGKNVNFCLLSIYTVNSRAVDRSTIQFWNFMAKGHST